MEFSFFQLIHLLESDLSLLSISGPGPSPVLVNSLSQSLRLRPGQGDGHYNPKGLFNEIDTIDVHLVMPLNWLERAVPGDQLL